MANDNLEDLYHPIFEKIYSQIKPKRRGILYYVIHEILNTDQEKANAICNEYGIKNSATLDEDKMIVNRITSNLNKIINMLEFKIPNLVNTVLSGLKDRERFGIVATACKLAGPLLCENYLNSQGSGPCDVILGGEEKKTNSRTTTGQAPRPSDIVLGRGEKKNNSQTTTPTPLKVALCLIVPAYIASSLQNEMPINISDIERLIDAASYFLCTEVEKADKLPLEITDKEILSDSNLEVYVRIDIDDGQAMIEKTIRYILKRNLPLNGQGKIQKLACLRSLSGLEVFNRV
jgi:hypothetical protein